MPITKINDSELFAQNRYHVNQGDVPGKTAAQMKEFMDYIPREVLIPKINELADSANAAAPQTASIQNRSWTQSLDSRRIQAVSILKHKHIIKVRRTALSL